MRLGDIYPRRRISAVESALRRDDPDLAEIFARWEDTERAAAHEQPRRNARLHALVAVLYGTLAAELLATVLLTGLSVIAAMLAALAAGLATWHLTRACQRGSVRREPRLRTRSSFAVGRRPGSLSRPR